ncbi:hypothetical protein J421_5010 (plasmid) [Gemmatirosa kalamazoonensis]|uniref:Uncharacterized protein n=1 Tax=Gemmatirosa kalamazoonensis TaxID=861299 RepID=W0RQC0_9BACT|nr:hypothetical protein [Gemmatirosa kalamazoonensis]AHG92545.1 hypothetical protein J421_5010 [Gemmatirosa kalamazoonensis]
MASPVRLYQKEMHDNMGFYATWLPGDRIEVGDAGVLEAGRFRKMATLRELGVDVAVEEAGAPQNVQYTATKGVRVESSAGAAVATVGKAEVSIEFAASGAFVFHATGLQQWSIRDRVALEERVRSLAESGQWRDEWLLVEAVHAATRATVIVSEDSAAGLVIDASADVPIPGVSLADPRVSLSVKSTHGRLVQVIGGEGLHPLYSCVRLRRHLFGGSSLDPVRGAEAVERHAAAAFVRPGIAELLDS